MANPTKIIPFILKWEGGLSKATTDTASNNPVPDGSGNHTNKGITWTTWSSRYGVSSDSINRFYKMTQADWASIFLPLFWNKLNASKINSQRIADILVNWGWAAGTHTPAVTVQRLVNVEPDGIIGNNTITAINKANEPQLFAALQNANYQFFNELGQRPQYSANLRGWINRLNDLYNNYLKNKITPAAAILATVVLLVVLSKK